MSSKPTIKSLTAALQQLQLENAELKAKLAARSAPRVRTVPQREVPPEHLAYRAYRDAVKAEAMASGKCLPVLGYVAWKYEQSQQQQ